jgi:hypothetical protein
MTRSIKYIYCFLCAILILIRTIILSKKLKEKATKSNLQRYFYYKYVIIILWIITTAKFT